MRRVVAPPGEGGLPCPPLLQQGVCPPCLQTSPRDTGASSRLPFQLPSHLPADTPMTAALATGKSQATVYVGPWTPCSPRDAGDTRGTRDIRDTRDTGGTGDTRDTRDTRHTRYTRDTRDTRAFNSQPQFPLPWLGPANPAEGPPSSPPAALGEATREVGCRVRASGATVPFKECMDGSRATVVPADRRTCVVHRDCKVSTITFPTSPKPPHTTHLTLST